jgi:hypothetical protein
MAKIHHRKNPAREPWACLIPLQPAPRGRYPPHKAFELIPLWEDIKHAYEVLWLWVWHIHAQLVFCNIKNQMLYWMEQTNFVLKLGSRFHLGTHLAKLKHPMTTSNLVLVALGRICLSLVVHLVFPTSFKSYGTTLVTKVTTLTPAEFVRAV